MKRRDIIFLVFMLVVGFASISSVLVVNGNIAMSFDADGFIENIVFTDAKTSDGTTTISLGEQNINFETKTLNKVGDTAILRFDITNKNREYNANVIVDCGLKKAYSSFNEYLSITTNITNPLKLMPGETKSGKLTIRLNKVYTETTTAVELMCTLSASPESRESLGNEYVPPYKDSILNGADPVLDGEKLVPIKIENNGIVTYADVKTEWYNYTNKEWANAVILVDNPSQTYKVNDIIKEDDIESYFVWIPRYKYQIFDKGEYASTLEEEPPLESNVKEIQIEFENKSIFKSNGTEVGEWLTHPAFTNYDTAGIWVGKFETGYKGATSESEAEQNVTDASKIIIKPNVYSWRSLTVSNMFKTSLSYEESMTSHMMRNTEWGALAYLSHSKYGINDEVRINNNSNYLTGYAANEKDASGSDTNNSQYNTETGYLASTTGNVTGVYDMSGGAWEYVASYLEDTPDKSGFTLEELKDEKYSVHLETYANDLLGIGFGRRILGDATGEMGPFYKINNANKNNWYRDLSGFVSPGYGWFERGGFFNRDSDSGQFAFAAVEGGAHAARGFRISLSF